MVIRQREPVSRRRLCAILNRIVLSDSGYGAACQKSCPLRGFRPEARLIENPEARPSACFEKPDGGNIPYFETVEAAAREQLQLAEQNLARRP